MNSITYAVTVCNESEELIRLLGILIDRVRPNDQVHIQVDSDNVTVEVKAVINTYKPLFVDRGLEFTVSSHKLDGNFSAFKNLIFNYANGDWIFQIDADEYPTTSLLDSIPYLIDENSEVDVILVPRINTVSGITLKDVQRWGWNISKFNIPTYVNNDDVSRLDMELLMTYDLIISTDGDSVTYYEPIINFPDYQFRLYNNSKLIRWENPVHEVLGGFDSYAPLPALEQFCLIHPKDVKRQRMQNSYYSSLANK